MTHPKISRYIQQILIWLNTGEVESQNQVGIEWEEMNLDLNLMKRVILMHGVGPMLFRSIDAGTLSSVPDALTEWLSDLYLMNSKRITRIHAELENILIQANKHGILTMPLKGSLLTVRYYTAPQMRPMADIDLLLKPKDFNKFHTLMENLGYRFINHDPYYANHYRYIRPKYSSVVDPYTEHPDNPIPVEIHTELRRSIFGRTGEIDLTEMIWEGSTEIQLFNQSAIMPEPYALITYLAVHATGHLLTQTGRILQWLDLALVENHHGFVFRKEHIDRVFIPLKLASRAFTRRFKNTNFSEIDQFVDPRIQKWSSQVPLDGRCGLLVQTAKPRSKIKLRLIRWTPGFWKLIIAYGRIPTSIAYIRFLGAFLGQIPRLFSLDDLSE